METINEYKYCPFCRQSIQRDAQVCQYCHRDLRSISTSAPAFIGAVIIGGLGLFMILVGVLLALSTADGYLLCAMIGGLMVIVSIALGWPRRQRIKRRG